MKTRTFCPSCGGYRDIEDGHRICTFCEYIDEQRDSAKTLPDQMLPRRFSVDEVSFTISFGTEQDHVVASVDADDPHYQLLADCLTAAWKRKPVELLESLCDHRALTVGIYAIMYGVAPERDPSNVSISDGATEIDVPAVFFSAVVVEVARLHLRAAGAMPWLTTLSSAARARIS